MSDSPKTIFVAGTDTDVGKTHVAAALARSLVSAGDRVGVYKPVASGCIPGTVSIKDDCIELVRDRHGAQGYRKALAEGKATDLVATDALKLWDAAGRPKRLHDVCPQKFLTPVAPPVAAQREGQTIDTDLLVRGSEIWKTGFDWLIIEGAGGLLSPLADGVLNIDLYKQFPGSRLLIVSANRLGTIHQTLATCESALARGCEISGIVLNQVAPDADDSADQNANEIQRYTQAPVLGCFDFNQQHWPETWSL